MRVYVPLTFLELVNLTAEGLLAGPRAAFAATEGLRDALANADQEECEYVAMYAAAELSASLGGDLDQRRMLIAVEAAEVAPVPSDEHPARVEIGDVALVQVVSAHVDLSHDAAPGGELAWFASQELPHLVEVLRG